MLINNTEVKVDFESKVKALQYMQILPSSEILLKETEEGYSVIYMAGRATITTDPNEVGVV